MKLLSYSVIAMSLINMNPDLSELLASIERTQQNSSILLHHDAITGTHNLLVKRDYEDRIQSAMNQIKTNEKKTLETLDMTVTNMAKNTDPLRLLSRHLNGK